MENQIQDGVAGWRGKLGWICPAVPSSYLVLDFHSVAPEGIELIIATLGIGALSDAEMETALSKIDDAARRLAVAGAQFISVEGAPMVYSKGPGFDREIIKRVQGIANVPITTSFTAAVEALHTLNLKKLVMASPMSDEIDQRAKKFFEDNGFQVIHIKSLNINNNRDIHSLPRSAAYTLAKQAYLEAPQAEGIYIACGGWCPPWVIDCLERDLGVPVIHSRQATTWAGLKALKIREPVKGWGKIFQTLYE